MYCNFQVIVLDGKLVQLVQPLDQLKILISKELWMFGRACVAKSTNLKPPI